MAKENPFIGKMDRVVEVYKTVSVPNELSEHKETQVLVSMPWACMKDVSGSEIDEGAVLSVVNRSYIIRRNPEIAAHGLVMTVTDRGVRFQVQAIKEIGKTHLELLVQVVGVPED